MKNLENNKIIYKIMKKCIQIQFNSEKMIKFEILFQKHRLVNDINVLYKCVIDVLI